MNARTTLNIALLVAIVAVGAALYYKSKNDSDEVQGTFAIVADAEENLRRIEIQRNREEPIVLERDGRHWRMKVPRAARIDQVQLGRLLDIARLRASVRMRAEDLARFELDKPWAQIRFNQNAVDFGSTNPLTRELYLRSGEHVYAVPPRLAAAVPGNAATLMAHGLFAVDEDPVAFQFARFSLRHDTARWHLAPHDPGLSQDDLERWVDQWRLASSVVTQPGSAAEGSESITIELRDTRKIMLRVLARSPDLVLLRHDELLQYHLPARLAPILLTPPRAASAPTR
jgi:hypothetical protein